MPSQDDTILITGPVGDLSYYKCRDRYFVRRKSGIPAERIYYDAAFARTRGD